MDEPPPLAEQEIKPSFRWSPKVGIILALTALMMAVPLVLVCVAIVRTVQPASLPVADEPAPKELRESLERAAEVIKPAGLGSEQRVVFTGPDRVKQTAIYFGTTAFESGEGRYWVRLPAEQREAFTQALSSAERPATIPSAASAPELIEVVVQPTPVTP